MGRNSNTEGKRKKQNLLASLYGNTIRLDETTLDEHTPAHIEALSRSDETATRYA